MIWFSVEKYENVVENNKKRTNDLKKCSKNCECSEIDYCNEYKNVVEKNQKINKKG